MESMGPERRSAGKMVLDRPKVELDKGMVVWAKLLEEQPSCAMEPKMVVQSIVAGGLDDSNEWNRIQIGLMMQTGMRSGEFPSFANSNFISIASSIVTIETTSSMMIASSEDLPRFLESVVKETTFYGDGSILLNRAVSSKTRIERAL